MNNIYSLLLQENAMVLQSKFPTIKEAGEFSVETISHPDPMSIHNFYIYFDIFKEGVTYINNIFDRHKKRLLQHNNN